MIKKPNYHLIQTTTQPTKSSTKSHRTNVIYSPYKNLNHISMKSNSRTNNSSHLRRLSLSCEREPLNEHKSIVDSYFNAKIL